MRQYCSDFAQYSSKLISLIQGLDMNLIDSISSNIIEIIKSDRNIYLIGNGGSASIVEHAYCDLTKSVSESVNAVNFGWVQKFNLLTLPSSTITAIANDVGYEFVYSWQIEKRLVKGDCLIAVSSSGNSKNIINAVMSAKNLGGVVIGLYGFDGSKLQSLSDIGVHVKSENYGLIEDVHSMIFHAITNRIVNLLA